MYVKKQKRTNKRKTANKMKTTNKKRNKTIKGGSLYLDNLPIRYYYQLNDEINNPNTPSIVVSDRLTTGGKKKNNKKNKKSLKINKKRGGFSVFNDVFLGDGTNLNSANSFFTSVGSKYMTGTLNATPVINSSVTTQPVETKYNVHNPPLA